MSGWTPGIDKNENTNDKVNEGISHGIGQVFGDFTKLRISEGKNYKPSSANLMRINFYSQMH